ncbi:MAG: transcription antitermination factor NusB [Planctomycetes bacterium]|nr:transcription antitermination factor NusB [Planctomycetota bacterium]
MRPRSVGRRLALQYLFMTDMNGYRDVESPGEFFQTQRRAVIENAAGGDSGFVFDRDDPHQDEAEEFASVLIRYVEKNQDTIDAAISSAASNWSLSRMGVIERNVLRIAAAELRQGDTPRNVILDEAVELAKRFGDKESGAFVNGIADRLAGMGRPSGRES